MSEIEPRICQDCGKDFGMDGYVLQRLTGVIESRCIACRDAHDTQIDSETPCPLCRRVGGTYVPHESHPDAEYFGGGKVQP